jgi:hypothetical protein
VQYCHSKGIHLSAHTPLGIPGGRASGPASSSEDAVESPAASIVYSRSRSVHAPMLKSHVVAEIAEHLGRTPAQVHILLQGSVCLFRSNTLKCVGSDGSLFLVCKVNVKVCYFLGYSFKVELTLCPVVFGVGSKDIHECNSWLPYRFVWGMSIVSRRFFFPPLFFFWCFWWIYLSK